jgi:hypothetical protein
LRPSVVNALMRMLDEHNPFVGKLRTASERLKDYPEENFVIRIGGAREGDAVQYNLPMTDDLAMLVVRDFSLDTFKHDIVIETRNKELKRILDLHLSIYGITISSSLSPVESEVFRLVFCIVA